MRNILRYVFIVWLINVLYFLSIMVAGSYFGNSTFSEILFTLLIIAFVYPATVLFAFGFLIWTLTLKNFSPILIKASLSVYTLFVVYLGKAIVYYGLYDGNLTWRAVGIVMYEALELQIDWLFFSAPTIITVWLLKLPKKKLTSESNLKFS